MAGLIVCVGLGGVAYALNYRDWSFPGIMGRIVSLIAGGVVLLDISQIWTGVAMTMILILVILSIFKRPVKSIKRLMMPV